MASEIQNGLRYGLIIFADAASSITNCDSAVNKDPRTQMVAILPCVLVPRIWLRPHEGSIAPAMEGSIVQIDCFL
jgi:hypothetical protein